MQFSLVLALSAASLAQANIQGAALLRRHMEAFPARATPVTTADDGSNPPIPPSCLSEALSIASSIPTPPPALLSEVEELQPTDICNFSVPPSLSADFSTYAQEMSSWTNEHMTELIDFAKSCGDHGADYSSLLGQCTATLAGKPKPTGTSSGPSRIQSVSATATATATATVSASGTAGASPSGGLSGSNSTQPAHTNAAAQSGVSALLLAAAGLAVLAL